MRVFITGATGFIGRHVVGQILNDGHDILALTRVRSANERNTKYIHWIYGDLGDFRSFIPAIKSFNPAVVIHLAWEGIPDFSYEMCKHNLDNSLQLINFMVNETECKKIIVSGTCLETGKKIGTCKESDGVNINSIFAWAKYSLYSYTDYLCRNQGIVLIWFRLFYAYGPGQRRESLIPMLFEMLRKREMPAIKNPLNANDFIYNEDIAEAFHEAVNRLVPSGIYNLGSGSPTKVIDICEIIERRITGNHDITDIIRNKINCEPEINFWADTNKTRDVLGWKYTTSLEEGIAKYKLSEGK